MKNAMQHLITAAALATASAAALGDTTVVYETEDPYGSFWGLVGFDISVNQSIATRFISEGTYALDAVSPWFMNNSETWFPQVTMTLRTDHVTAEGSFPSDEILESWTFTLPMLGWNPVQEVLASVENPVLEAGKNYWLVAESFAPPLENPVWLWAFPGLGLTSSCHETPCGWTPAEMGAVVAVTVTGTPAEPPCAPADLNCDGSVGVPDLLLLLAAWGECSDCTPGNCAADLNGDCNVGVADLLILLANWG